MSTPPPPPNLPPAADVKGSRRAQEGEAPAEPHDAAPLVRESLLAPTPALVRESLLAPTPAGIPSRGPRSSRIRPDGTFRDDFYIERGYWEAKDTHDDLETEIKKKTARGYPLTNAIFEDTRTAVLYQNNRREMVADLTKPQELADLLNAFFSHTEPAHDNFEKTGDEFKQRVPDLARVSPGIGETYGSSIKNLNEDHARLALARRGGLRLNSLVN